MVVLCLLVAAAGTVFFQLGRPALTWMSAIEINREIQQNISNYLFSVSVINICLGAVVGAGLCFMGVPGALLSVPILVSIKVVCDHVPTLSSVSELLTN